MNRAHWTVARTRTDDTGRRVVFIIDNDGPKSVTNDAENVVKDIYTTFNDCRIFYRDSMGRWDELCHKKGKFNGFQSGTDGWATPE